MDVLDKVAESISRYNMIPANCRVGVAVSGGADSTFLLQALWQLGHRPLIVLHINHHLRGNESAADESRVRQMARQQGLEFLSLDWWYGQQSNLEQAARDARRDWFTELIATDQIDRVATGHTKSDQAETVLFRLLRGSGSRGLAGVLSTTREGIIRPLINVERVEIEDWLEGKGIDWSEDASNRDTTLVRNRIRHELLPHLRDEWNPSIVDALSQLAELSASEEIYWQEEINQILPSVWRKIGGTYVATIEPLVSKPLPVQRRLLRAMIEKAKGDLRQIDFSHIENVLLLLNSSEGSGRIQIPGLDVFRSFDWVRFAEPGSDTLEGRDYQMQVQLPGEMEIPNGAGVICTELVDLESVYTEGSTLIDLQHAVNSLVVRNWRPGDRYHPESFTDEVKLKNLFQDHRIPLWDRRHWPMICVGEQILWAERFGVAKGYTPQPGSKLAIKVSVVRK